MRKCRLLLISLIVFLLTGCSGTYNITLNQNLTVNEKIDFNMKDTGGIYDRAKELFINNNIDEKKYKIVQKDNEVNIKYEENYDSIEDYVLNSVLYKQLFDEIYYSKEDKKIDFTTSSKLKLDSNNQDNIINDYNVDLLKIVFKTPLDVYSTNSDETYKNEYTWNITSKTTEKEIIISLDPTNKELNYKYIVVIGLIIIISVISLIILLRRFRGVNKL